MLSAIDPLSPGVFHFDKEFGLTINEVTISCSHKKGNGNNINCNCLEQYKHSVYSYRKFSDI